MDDFDVLITFAAELNDGTDHPPCLDLGDPESNSGFPWGDVNCDGLINVMDALAIILYGADYPYSQTEPCPLIGEEVHVSGFN